LTYNEKDRRGFDDITGTGEETIKNINKKNEKRGEKIERMSSAEGKGESLHLHLDKKKHHQLSTFPCIRKSRGVKQGKRKTIQEERTAVHRGEERHCVANLNDQGESLSGLKRGENKKIGDLKDQKKKEGTQKKTVKGEIYLEKMNTGCILRS